MSAAPHRHHKYAPPATAIIALATILFPPTLRATTIVAIRTPKFIVIASDSKAVFAGEIGPPKVCKIYQRGHLFFAVAGLVHDTGRAFDVPTIVATAFSPSANFKDGVARAEKALSSSLLTELRRLKSEAPDLYRYTTREGDGISIILFARFEGATPYSAASEFRLKSESSIGVSIHRMTCPGDCTNGVQAFFLGKQEAIHRFLTEHAGQTFQPVDWARMLVETEILSAPADVGPPVTILKLKSSGPTWISNDTGCPTILH